MKYIRGATLCMIIFSAKSKNTDKFDNCDRKGQLGRGTLTPETVPERIPALGGLNIIQIDCGKWHNVALTSEGDLYVWGWNKFGQLGLPCPDFEVNKAIKYFFD
jgi:alpha-tubulin suppressor-like RCC1 family protein